MRATRAFAACFFVAVAGCDRAPSRLGLDEPIRVREGVFHPGDLPGTQPDADGGTGTTIAITALENANGIVQWREAGKALGGRATRDVFSVAVRFATFGTGYWVVPAGAIDATQNDERVWSMTADFGDEIPTGLQRLRFVAFDGEGRAGTQRDIEVCIVGATPDNLNACDPAIAPPREIFSLTWDTNVDLDLRVLTPDGKWVEWKRPTTTLGDGGRIDRAALSAPDVGSLNRDSNGGCAIDGIRREDLVWQGSPRPGVYRVYANLFDACGLGSVNWRFTEYRRDGNPDAGLTHLVEQRHIDGTLGAQAANGGASSGTFVTEITLP